MPVADRIIMEIIATGGTNSTIIILDISSGAILHAITDHADSTAQSEALLIASEVCGILLLNFFKKCTVCSLKHERLDRQPGRQDKPENAMPISIT